MVQPLDLQVFARVEQIAGNLQLEQEQRTNAEDDLSNRLVGTNAELNQQAARLGARVDAVARRLDEIREAFDDQIAEIRTEIEELEDLIAYFEYCAFAAQSPLSELLERIGITTVEQLRGREAEELHNELSRIAAQEPHYQAVPAVRRRRVTDEFIRWSRRAPSGDNGRPAGDRSPARRRRPSGRGTQTG
jgi:DNA repair exonuclease SbcCD ATPase subunit